MNGFKTVKTKIVIASSMLLSGAVLAADGNATTGGISSAKQAFSGITDLANEFISMAWPLVTLLVLSLIHI